MRKVILHIVFTLFFSMQALFADGWEVVSEMPIPVMGGQALVKENLIYIVGGYTDSTYSPLNKIQVYDSELNTWEILSDTLIVPRYGHNVVMHENNAIIFGGNPGQDSINFSIEIWDFGGMPYWYDHHPTFGRNFAAAQVYGNDLFFFGGQIYNLIDSLQSAYLIQYNIPTAEVTFKSDTLFTDVLPLQQTSASLNDKIYIFGGAYNGVLKTIYRFDPAAVVWEGQVSNMIEKRAGGIAVAVGENRVLIIGGYNEQVSALSSVEMFEADGDSYHINNMYFSMNYARTELMAAAVGEYVYVFGGKDGDGACVSTVEISKIGGTTQIDEYRAASSPAAFELKDNYPNPFNPITRIGYQISANESSPQHVRLSVYDILGKEVVVLVDEEQNPGFFEIDWNAEGFAGGIYFYRLSTSFGVQTKSMLLIR